MPNSERKWKLSPEEELFPPPSDGKPRSRFEYAMMLAQRELDARVAYARDMMGHEEFNDLRRLCKTKDEFLDAFAQWEHDDHQQ